MTADLTYTQAESQIAFTVVRILALAKGRDDDALLDEALKTSTRLIERVAKRLVTARVREQARKHVGADKQRNLRLRRKANL